ncbi:type II toxin-antitoxin system VapB family antitoxin [Parapedobacter soli]|uniref:type II toxin-antitoxin system VapB family antitoxin n=1 Tax=Parapedobacter soli TaxID=416955 RepID=UPI0021C65148|nr:type II toxin-antitoxin system VapB family antitoxin [Parapedobacter soli]
MTRTTLDIPELIAEAMVLTGSKTKNQLIKEVLEAHIKRIRRKRLVALKGTLDFDIDLDTLPGREDVKV